MAAQLICNQWVAGSTPVTSSKKNPAIYRQNYGIYRGVFAFICAANLSECASFLPYCSKNALPECSNGRQKKTTRRSKDAAAYSFSGWNGVKTDGSARGTRNLFPW
jgi:hypothetical protein